MVSSVSKVSLSDSSSSSKVSFGVSTISSLVSPVVSGLTGFTESSGLSTRLESSVVSGISGSPGVTGFLDYTTTIYLFTFDKYKTSNITALTIDYNVLNDFFCSDSCNNHSFLIIK